MRIMFIARPRTKNISTDGNTKKGGQKYFKKKTQIIDKHNMLENTLEHVFCLPM